MLAIAIAEPGGPEVLRPVEVPVPQPAAGEVLIRVAAAGVNRPDLMQREGKYPPPPCASEIPGLEIAGTIASCGPGTQRWQEGDQVCALVSGGAYAEYCTAPAVQCLPVPSTLDLVSASGVPETFFTVWTNVFERGRLSNGESFLVHGGSSGIGTTAIQMARAFGARVFATAGTDEKCRACERLGAERAINYRNDDFAAVVMEATKGSTLRARTVEEKGAIAQALERIVWPLVESRAVMPVIHARFPLKQAAEAHRLMESGSHIGKIVLTV